MDFSPDWQVTPTSHAIPWGCSYAMPQESAPKLTSALRQCQAACASYPGLIHNTVSDSASTTGHAHIAPQSYHQGDKPFAALLLSQAHLCLLLCMHILQQDASDSPSRAMLGGLVQSMRFVCDNLAHDQASSRNQDDASKPRIIEWRCPLHTHALDTVLQEYRLSAGAVNAYHNRYCFDDLCHHIQVLLYMAVSCCKAPSLTPRHWAWWRKWLTWENLGSQAHDYTVLTELARIQRDLSLFTLHHDLSEFV